MILNRSKQRLTLAGITYSPIVLQQLAMQPTADTSPFLGDLYMFLQDWWSESPTMTVQTSGSTGVPKQITVCKEQMMQSARLTCEFFHLCPGDAALLCMPLEYIAGKMMVVRALVGGLNLIVRTPSGNPFADVDIPLLRFAALVPSQLYNTLRVPQERERLCNTKVVIIGGGTIEANLEAEVQTLPNAIYSTYGMTETLSHIALRRLNGAEASPHYQPLPGVALGLSLGDTLVITAPLVCNAPLVTTDVAQIHADGTFSILGRTDNIINSGGVKIHPEKVEAILRQVIKNEFAVTSVVDAKWGEVVVLLISNAENVEEIERFIAANLPKHERPKQIVSTDKLLRTKNGKIDRAACKAIVRRMIDAISH